MKLAIDKTVELCILMVRPADQQHNHSADPIDDAFYYKV